MQGVWTAQSPAQRPLPGPGTAPGAAGGTGSFPVSSRDWPRLSPVVEEGPRWVLAPRSWGRSRGRSGSARSRSGSCTVPACAVPGAEAVLSVLLSPAAVKGPGAELPLGPGGAGGDRVRHAATWRLPARTYWRK